jgi:hypothetical protein
MLMNETKRSLTANLSAAATRWQPSAGLHPVALCLGALSSYSFMGGNRLQGQTESIQRQTIKDRRRMKS